MGWGERAEVDKSTYLKVGDDGVLRIVLPGGWDKGVAIDVAIADGQATRLGGTEPFWGTSFMVTADGSVKPVPVKVSKPVTEPGKKSDDKTKSDSKKSDSKSDSTESGDAKADSSDSDDSETTGGLASTGF